MKRLFIVFSCITLLLCGCDDALQSKRTQMPSSHGKIKIVTTIFPLYDFARSVAGDKAEVSMLVSVGAEVHSYEPTPKDIITISQSDLFVNIGGSADPWSQKVLQAQGSEKLATVSAIDCVELKDELTVEGMESEHDDDEHEHSYAETDEHVWTSPENAEEITEAICAALSRIDTENAAYYKRNAESYCEKLEHLDEKLDAVTDHAKRKTIVFADRFPFRYLADEYDLKYYAAFPGCSSESEPSAATVSFLVKKIQSENIPIVFYTETSNGKIADTVCEATGAKKLLLHSCHNITKEQFETGVSYLDLMEDNVTALKTALN